MTATDAKQPVEIRRFLIAITYNNRDTFISVVAWVLILYGASTAYTSLSQLITAIWFHPTSSAQVYFLVTYPIMLAFALAFIWCGMGLVSRDRSRLNALIVVLWLYVILSVGMIVWLFVDELLLSSRLDTWEEGVSEPVERLRRSGLATSVFYAIRTVVQTAVVVWVIGHLSSRMIKDKF